MNIAQVEAATARFYEWELRGRGWKTYSHRVQLEPSFVPFAGHREFPRAIVDDARKPTFVSSLIDRLCPPSERLKLERPTEIESPTQPEELSGQDWVDLEVLIPPETKVDPHVAERLLLSLATAGPLCFELIGAAGAVTLRITGDASAASRLRAQLHAFVPAATVREPERDLLSLWKEYPGASCGCVEFGLAREFMVPLATLRPIPDPLTSLVGALSSAGKDSLALVQIMFERAAAPWAENVMHAVTSPDGEPFFFDAPGITALAEEKTSTPLYAAVVRTLAIGDDDALGAMLGGIAAAFGQYAAPGRNSFVPLACEDSEQLEADILERCTHRSGMLLSLDELASLVHLPGEHLRASALLREVTVEKALPAGALSHEGVVLGEAMHRSRAQEVRLPLEARLQHTHIIGASGTGKSTLLEQLILQDIQAGRGVAVIDPHGDLIDEVVTRIPDDRIEDVILFDPADDEGVIGWNILGAHSQIEKELLASDLVAVFRRLSTSWGDQMNALLANAVLAFLESSQGGTLIELRKFLLDDVFREAFLRTVRDDHVVSFWRDEYPLLIGRKPQAPILTRLDTFLRSKLIRERVTEREKPLNFRDIIDSGRIFLAKLAQGAIGEENAALLGSLLVSKFHQVSLSRQDVAREKRPPFFLYVDEFQQVATPSMAGLFSGVRKYQLAATVAHQDLYQLHASAPELERAVLANAYARVAFRVSADDARRLERDIGEFTAEDLGNLARGQAVCRLGRSDDSFRLTTRPLENVDPADVERRQLRIRRTSVAIWGRPRITLAPSASEPPPSVAPRPAGAERPVAVQPSRALPKPISEVPGRGGPLHKYLQGLISGWAHEHQFRAEIESSLPDGGRVDVLLTHDAIRIACEVAGTTTIEHELANVRKCLTAGVTHVCEVSLDRNFLRKLEEEVDEALGETDRERVHCFSPEELLAFLGTQMMTQSAPRVAGYKVEVRGASKSTGEADRRRGIAEIMMKSLRRMRDTK